MVYDEEEHCRQAMFRDGRNIPINICFFRFNIH
jgi:hypothetical protein